MSLGGSNSRFNWKQPFTFPFVATLASYPKEHHSAVSTKFLALWFLSIFPILLVVLRLNNTAADDVGPLSLFYSTDPIVYSVSYICPLLFLFYERNKWLLAYAKARKRSPHLVPDDPPWFGLVLFTSLIAFGFSLYVYGEVKMNQLTSGNVGSPTLIKFSTVAVYLYGVYCWYLSLLMAHTPSLIDFVEHARNEEQITEKGLHERVKNQGAES